jgi:hypothetical protein
LSLACRRRQIFRSIKIRVFRVNTFNQQASSILSLRQQHLGTWDPSLRLCIETCRRCSFLPYMCAMGSFSGAILSVLSIAGLESVRTSKAMLEPPPFTRTCLPTRKIWTHDHLFNEVKTLFMWALILPWRVDIHTRDFHETSACKAAVSNSLIALSTAFSLKNREDFSSMK